MKSRLSKYATKIAIINMGLLTSGMTLANVSAIKEGTSYAYIVKKGDTMSSIAKKVYHDGALWRTMAQKNKTIANPHHIYPGETIYLPKMKKVTLTTDPFGKYRPYFGLLTSGMQATLSDVSNLYGLAPIVKVDPEKN